MLVIDRREILWILPGILSVPLVTIPVPSLFSPSRELGHYYQSLAFAHDPLSSFTVLTFRESGAGIHLFSILSSPLLPVFGPASGRIVSLLLGICTGVLVGLIATRLFDRRVGLLAPVVLWAHPFFYRFTWTWFPESISLLTTCLAVYAAVCATRDDSRAWLCVSALAIGLGIANHSWEATIALPLTVWFLLHERWEGAGAIVATKVVNTVVVRWITDLQPSPFPVSTYGIHEVGVGILLTSDFWLSLVTLPFSPFFAGHGTITLLALSSLAYWIKLSSATPRGTRALFTSWIVSAVAIPLLLPAGLNHPYYLWPWIVPVVLTGTVVLVQLIDWVSTRSMVTRKTVRNTVISSFLLLMMLKGAVFEFGLLSGGPTNAPARVDETDRTVVPQSEIESAADSIRRQEIDSVERLVFVTDPEHARYIYRVLVVAELEIPRWQASRNGPPYRAQSPQNATDCELMVVLDDNAADVRKCPGTST